ncbi:Tonsoku-like protein [Frankliniella fusca]|uniref:Tonsoku-like protein n=1 Tax=Frankliniella fusca TaxID=407009 RepID=A0AAE1HUD2_9NEOP|nr:Tonsoku-like protein [Frankliniella fusca]
MGNRIKAAFSLLVACLEEIDGPSEGECTQCNQMGFRVRFSAHLTVLDTGEQNEKISIIPEGAHVAADCTSAEPSIQKVLVLWGAPDDVTDVTSTTTISKFFVNRMPVTTRETEYREYPETESTRSPERASTLTVTSTSQEISSASTITASEMTTAAVTSDAVTFTDNLVVSTDSTATVNDYTTLPTTTNSIFQETAVMSEGSTHGYGTATSTGDSTSTVVSEIYTLDTFTTETFADLPETHSTTTLSPSLYATLTENGYSTASTEAFTLEHSSTTRFMKTDETDSYLTETSTGTTSELDGTKMVTSLTTENSESTTQSLTPAESSLEVLNYAKYRLKRSADMRKPTTNEIILYFKEDNTTYFLNKVWISFTVEKLGIQYVQYMEGLHRWVTPIGYAYECAENVSFPLKDAILTLENMMVAAFIPSACKFPSKCKSELHKTGSPNHV